MAIVQFAIDVLRSNRAVQRFCCAFNSFNSTEDAYKLVDAVLEHPTISEVSFRGSFRHGITTYLPVKRLFCGLGTDALLELDLANNGIKTNGDRCIPDFLSTNPPLERLFFWGNRLNDDDALNIAVALQSNTHLIHLSLYNNELTENGKSIFYHQSVLGVSPLDLSALQSISGVNMNSVSGANHTCNIHGIPNCTHQVDWISEKTFMNDSSKSSKWNRRRKLLWLLEKMHHDGVNMTQIVSEFSEDDLGLVPQVLACINTYATDYGSVASIYNLSLIFELARDWKTPEMYQFRHA